MESVVHAFFKFLHILPWNVHVHYPFLDVSVSIQLYIHTLYTLYTLYSTTIK